jgi:hypothetical protein
MVPISPAWLTLPTAPFRWQLRFLSLSHHALPRHLRLYGPAIDRLGTDVINGERSALDLQVAEGEN